MHLIQVKVEHICELLLQVYSLCGHSYNILFSLCTSACTVCFIFHHSKNISFLIFYRTKGRLREKIKVGFKENPAQLPRQPNWYNHERLLNMLVKQKQNILFVTCLYSMNFHPFVMFYSLREVDMLYSWVPGYLHSTTKICVWNLPLWGRWKAI